MTSAIELVNLRKAFRTHRGGQSAFAVDGVDLEIEKGEFVTLLGSSGCGKTTTLRMIAGLEMPTSGKILRDGTDITDQPASDRGMRMVFQDFALFPNMTVAENVAFGLKVRRMRGRFRADEIAERVRRFLDIVQLSGHADKRPHQLSGGQKQRVSLARALVTDPEVVLFDEPLGSLDANLRQVMQVELSRLHRQLGKTFVYVTHDQDEAMAMSDRIAVMNEGKVLQFAAPREIYDNPGCRYVATFIGHAKVVDGRVSAVSGSEARIRLPSGQEVLTTGVSNVAVGQEVGVRIRSDDVSLAETSGADVTGTISDVLFRGDHFQYVVDLPQNAGTLHVSRSPHLPVLEKGSSVGLRIDPTKARVLVN
jgi:ABC-type Fe3+/spermidine/putrescine transport system ATPase subunit